MIMGCWWILWLRILMSSSNSERENSVIRWWTPEWTNHTANSLCHPPLQKSSCYSWHFQLSPSPLAAAWCGSSPPIVTLTRVTFAVPRDLFPSDFTRGRSWFSTSVLWQGWTVHHPLKKKNLILWKVWLQLPSPRAGNFELAGDDGDLWLCFLSISGYFFSCLSVALNSDESLEPA